MVLKHNLTAALHIADLAEIQRHHLSLDQRRQGSAARELVFFVKGKALLGFDYLVFQKHHSAPGSPNITVSSLYLHLHDTYPSVPR
jgi:hypothetical protein